MTKQLHHPPQQLRDLPLFEFGPSKIGVSQRLPLSSPTLCGATIRFFAAFWLAAFCPSLFAAPPPELTVLRQQYEKVVAERVTAPFDAGLAELNAKYGAGLDRAIADAKAAGKLEDMLAIEAEKKRLTDKLPIPATDDDAEPVALKKFRAIYREQSTAITAARDAAQLQLLPPYEAKLRELEASLVKNDRVAEAKEVLAYRQGLALGAPAPVSPPMAATGAPTTSPVAVPAKTSYPKGDDRKAAEWVLGQGGTVTLLVGGKRMEVNDTASLPAAKFELTHVFLKFLQGRQPTTPITDLLPLAGLQHLQVINISGLSDLADDDLALLSSLPAMGVVWFNVGNLTDAVFPLLARAPTLTEIHLGSQPAITGSRLGLLSGMKTLSYLDLGNGSGLTPDGFATLGKLGQLKRLYLDGTSLTDAELPLLAGMKGLVQLEMKKTAVTAVGLAGQKFLGGLKILSFSPSGGDMASHAGALAKTCPVLDNLIITGKQEAPMLAADIAALGAFSKLRRLMLYAPGVTEEVLGGLSAIPGLEDLEFGYLRFSDACLPPLLTHKTIRTIHFGEAQITDSGLLSLVKMKTLKHLDLTKCLKLTPAGIAAFKKQRPDITFEL